MGTLSNAISTVATHEAQPPARTSGRVRAARVTRRSIRRGLAAAVLAVGLGGVGLSSSHPEWFSGSTSDAGAMGVGNGPIRGTGGPIRSDSSDWWQADSRTSQSSDHSSDHGADGGRNSSGHHGGHDKSK